MMRCRRRLGNNGFYQSGLTFHAPFDDPTDPKKVLIGGALTMVRATKGWYLNPLTNFVTEAANNILRIEANGALIEGQRTNYCLQSRDFDTTWGVSSASVSQNEVGIDGVANTAWTLTDTSNSVLGYLNQDIGIPDDSNTDVFSFFIKKDDDETRFPEIQLNQTGGTATQHFIRVNTKTGATYEHTDSENDVFGVEDFNDTWWRFWIATTNDGSGNTTARIYIRPSVATTINGGGDVSLQGSIVIDGAQFEKDVPLPSSFIPTTDAAVTRNADDLTFASSGHLSDTEGTIVLKSDTRFSSAAMYYLSFNTTRSIRARDDGELESYDGTDIRDLFGDGSIIEGATHSLGMKWWSSSVSGALDGTVGSTFGYDGGWEALTNINIGSSTAVASQLFGHIKNLRIWDVALSDAQMQGLTG